MLNSLPARLGNRVGTPSGCENLYEAKSCPPYLDFSRMWIEY